MHPADEQIGTAPPELPKEVADAQDIACQLDELLHRLKQIRDAINGNIPIDGKGEETPPANGLLSQLHIAQEKSRDGISSMKNILAEIESVVIPSEAMEVGAMKQKSSDRA